MSKWPKVHMGSLADFRNGLNYSAADRGSGLAVVGVRDFQDHSFVRFDELEELAPSALSTNDALIAKDDIIFVRSNGNRELIGRSLLVQDQPAKATSHSGFTIRLRFHDKRALPAFYAYFLRSGVIRQVLSSQGGGTSINNLNQGILARLEVPLPPLDTQRRIAGILGAYDDLIEVNRRRVAVLEAMARGLFEEWFVRFRFPGHEHHPLQDTPEGPLPEGWRWVPFSELARFTNGFAFKPSDFEDGGLPIVKIPELKNGVTAKTPRNSGIRVPKHLYLDTGDLLFSWSGTLAVQPWIDGPALLNQHLFKVEPFDIVGRGFLLASLNAAMPRFLLQGVGATMQHIRRSALDNTAVALPGDEALLKRADQFLAGIYADLVNTQAQSRKLAAARDLLLPRLISGQLDMTTATRELETAA